MLKKIIRAVIPGLIAAFVLAGCQNIKRLTGHGYEDARWDEFYNALYSEDFAAAREFLDELQASSDVDRDWKEYGEYYLSFELEQLDDALESLDTLIERWDVPEYLALRGEVYVEMHRLEDGKEDLEDALSDSTGLSFYPMSSDRESMTIYHLWRAEIGLGQFKEAESTARELFDNFPNENAAGYCELELALMEGDTDRAHEILDSVLRNNQQFTDEEFGDAWQIYEMLWRCRITLDDKDPELAQYYLDQIYKSDPDIGRYWVWTANLAHISGRYHDSRAACLEGLVRIGCGDILQELGITVPESISGIEGKQGPIDVGSAAYLLCGLGHTSLLGGNLDESLACAEKALELDPYETYAYHLMIYSLWLKGLHDQALEAIEGGLEIDPYSYDLGFFEIYHLKYYTDTPETELNDKLNTLMDHLLAYHDRWPDNPYYNLILALCLNEAGEFETAHDLFTQVYESGSYHFDNARNLALSMALDGDLDGAIELLSGFELEPSLFAIISSYSIAMGSGSAEQLDLADWLSGQMDPFDRFAEYVDPFEQAARESCGVEGIIEE